MFISVLHLHDYLDMMLLFSDKRLMTRGYDVIIKMKQIYILRRLYVYSTYFSMPQRNRYLGRCTYIVRYYEVGIRRAMIQFIIM